MKNDYPFMPWGPTHYMLLPTLGVKVEVMVVGGSVFTNYGNKVKKMYNPANDLPLHKMENP